MLVGETIAGRLRGAPVVEPELVCSRMFSWHSVAGVSPVGQVLRQMLEDLVEAFAFKN